VIEIQNFKRLRKLILNNKKTRIMKRSALIGVLLAIASTTMVSCKKEYYCDCKKIYTGSNSYSSYDDDVYVFRDTRTRAESRCNDEEKTGSDLGGSYSRECEIR
jgi:hypothetical protein